MFKKIFKFFAGYVILEVVGKNKERFINMCLANGIDIFKITPTDVGFVIGISNSDYKSIRRLVRKSRVRTRIVKKCGFKEFYKTHRHRYGFLISACFVVLFIMIAPRFIWCVEIDGAKTADTERIAEILKEHGVYIGARKSKVDDLSEIKNAIIFGDVNVNWAWLYFEGAKARLAVQEMTLPPEIADKRTPTDIIASSDGYIKKAEVRRGQRYVNKGMTVTKGQLLVSGKVAVFREGYPEKYSYVNSDAEIIADTVHTATKTFSSKEILRIKTGRKKKVLSFDLFGKRFNFIKSAENIFDKYETETKNYDLTLPLIGYVGIGVNVHNVYEVKETENILTEEEILSRAKECLEEEICKKLTQGAEKTGEEITYSADGDNYTVTMRMRLRENIGIKIPLEE